MSLRADFDAARDQLRTASHLLACVVARLELEDQRHDIVMALQGINGILDTSHDMYETAWQNVEEHVVSIVKSDGAAPKRASNVIDLYDALKKSIAEKNAEVE